MDVRRKLVKADCRELLSRFQNHDSVRFDTFGTIWREMKFDQIFYGAVKREKRTLSRLILDTACSFFLPPFSFQIRVGGLYLLYGLYHSQTASPPEQIRLALRDWDDVQKFEREAVSAQHFDVIFILRQLGHHKAFTFTAMPTELSFRKKRMVERSKPFEEFMAQATGPQELVTTELLEEMSNIHDLYEKLKSSVPAVMSDSGTNLIQKDMVPQLRSSVLDFHQWQNRKDGTAEGGEEDSGEGTSQEECSRRAELLSSIKSKAYGEAAEASRSRRHRQVEVEPGGAEAGSAHPTGPSRQLKPSLKSRTNENLLITGEMWKETMTSTQINCLTSLDSAAEAKAKKEKIFQR